MVKRLQKSAITAAIVTLCLLLAAVLMFAFVPTPRKAYAETSVWDGNLEAAGWGDTEVSAPGTYAKDTVNKKIEIGSAAALAYFAHEVYYDSAHTLDGYTVTLMTDIDLGGEDNCWIPIGGTNRKDLSTRFSGTFNGNGHTVSNFSSKSFYDNIKYDATAGYYVDAKGDDSVKVPFQNDDGEFAFGLFGVTANMTVKKLKMSNVQFDFADKVVNKTLVSDNVGAIIGYNAGSLKVEDCEVGKLNDEGKADSTIKIATAGNPAIGGLVGRAYANKQAGSTTTTSTRYESVLMENCQNYIDIEYTAGAVSDQCGKVSGILGYSTNFKNCQFKNCTNYGNINGGQFAGGIMAFFSDNKDEKLYDTEDERVNNAWTLDFDGCVNYGDITSSNLDTENGYKEGKTYSGGITAHLSPSTRNYSSIISTNTGYNKLPSVNFYITNCRNYGDIKVYNTEAKNGTDNPDGKGWNAAGGIIGSLTASETGKNILTNNYNYGNVESIAKEGSTYYTPRMGGYIGWLYYYWGTEAKDHPNYIEAELRPINLTMTGGSCGNVIGENKVAVGGNSHVGNLIGSDYTYPNKALAAENYFTLVDANGEGNIIRGTQPTETGATSVTIDETATEIEAAAYFGQNQLTEVSFAENSTLAKIGDWAFAGTGLTQVNLPASVNEIGKAAFGNNVLVIAENKAHYDALKASDKVSDDAKALLTYAIAVEYRYLNMDLGTVYKLHGKPYGLVLGEDGKWTEQENVELGTDKTEAGAVWYADGKAVDVDAVSELLEGDVETIVLETYTSDKKVFFARTNLVYDGTEYDMTELNSLLQATGDRILPTMTAEVIGYVDPDNNAASDNEVKEMTSICDAGTYTVEIVDGKEKYEIDIKIARATVDLSSYSNLSWRLTTIGQFTAANAELLDANGVTLYVYTDSNGKEYPTRELLTDARIAELNLNSAYTTRTVLYSVVRNRGQNVTIEVVANSKYDIDDQSYLGNVGNKVGAYEASVEITANKNYKFTKSTVSAQRGLDIKINDDAGKTAEITKTWYIVEMSNWLVSASGGDYVINNRVYGDTAAVAAPSIQYGTKDKISMSLRLNGTPIESSSVSRIFGVGDFSKYINSAMPAGNYELVVTVDDVESEEVDTEATTNPESPAMVTVYRRGFTETIVFTVEKAQLPSLDNVNAALKGKTFTYTWDGNSHLYDAQAAQVVNGYLGASTPSRSGTVWANLNAYFGRFAITFNLASLQSDAYFGANDMTVATANPDKYTVYYRISAPNYYSSTENLATGDKRQNYYFNVVNIREIEVPTVSDVAYTGFAVYPTITPAATGDEAFYEVLWATDGYLTGGQRTVTFKLRNSDYYCWEGEEVGVDVVSVPFKIVAADNAWLRTPNIVSWLFEEFNTEVNRIRAVPMFLDDGETVKFAVTDRDGNSVTGLNKFTVKDDGTISDQTLIAALNSLKSGSYKLLVTIDATNNYKELTADIDFNIGKAMNAWANGDEDLVLPGWIIGNYSAKQNPIVVNPVHGEANIIITDLNGKEYYNSVTGLNKLNDCAVGKYLLKAWVDETTDFAALAERTFTIEVFEKAGMPWWGTLLITLGALLLAALIIFILWKKGVFQILTGKILLAIRNKATVDATIAAVRASKKAEEAKKTVAEAKRKERMAELQAKAAEARALPAEQRAAALEEKARKAAERAEKMKAKAESMQMRADRMKERANEDAETELQGEATATEAPTTEAPKAESAVTEPTVTETPQTEAAATEAPVAEEPQSETAATEEPATEEPKEETTAPKTTKTSAKKKPSNKK